MNYYPNDFSFMDTLNKIFDYIHFVSIPILGVALFVGFFYLVCIIMENGAEWKRYNNRNNYYNFDGSTKGQDNYYNKKLPEDDKPYPPEY